MANNRDAVMNLIAFHSVFDFAARTATLQSSSGLFFWPPIPYHFMLSLTIRRPSRLHSNYIHIFINFCATESDVRPWASKWEKGQPHMEL